MELCLSNQLNVLNWQFDTLPSPRMILKQDARLLAPYFEGFLDPDLSPKPFAPVSQNGVD